LLSSNTKAASCELASLERVLARVSAGVDLIILVVFRIFHDDQIKTNNVFIVIPTEVEGSLDYARDDGLLLKQRSTTKLPFANV
jgi:hypothetical protein